MRALGLVWILSAVSSPAVVSPSDEICAFVHQALHASSYKRADADLNGDGRSEVLVYVTDQHYCGTGGCALFILSPHGRSYRVVLRSTVTQLPISLLSTSTRGWRDIGVTVSGGGIIRPYLARLRFNGRRYPNNPSAVREFHLSRSSGKVLIYN